MNTSTTICVYAICKNESKFIDRWVHSLQGEADYVVVLDTGSTDDSVKKLKFYSPFVKVEQFDYFSKLSYFRFDKARNDSLKLVPYDVDICVVLDLDQVPRKGWSNIIRNRFKEGYSEIYGDIIDHDKDNNELNRWKSRNVHPNSPYWIWNKVIHEGLEYYGKDKYKGIYDSKFIIDHYPDPDKDRSLYKELLYYSCKEYPKDPYYGIYLGIELSRRYSPEEATEAFRRCLRECDFTDNDDIRYQTYINLAMFTNNTNEALESLIEAETFADIKGIKTRRLYKVFADIYEKIDDIDNAINSLLKALQIQSNSNDWKEDQRNFSGYIEDRLSLFYYFKKDYLNAIKYCEKALSFDKDNERIRNNLEVFKRDLEFRRSKDGK